MVDIPGLGNIFSGWDVSSIMRQTLITFEIIAGVVAVFLVFYFFILKPRRYKDFVEITDLGTNQKYTDGGYLKRNRDGTQEYVLKKDKHAKLPEPPASIFLTKKGKVIRQLVKYGPGDYNWASAREAWDVARNEIKTYLITNVTDQNWNKYKIKTEAERKAKTSGIIQYLPHIMIGAVIVMFIISAWYITGVMKEAVATGGSVMGRANEITEKQTDVLDRMSQCSVSSNTPAPPPDI